MTSSIRMHVHTKEDLRLDGILRLIEEGSKPGPLESILRTMCEQVAVIAHADVVSMYVREQSLQGDELVMRANIGFPSSAIGRVRLQVGEGLTGTAAEIMRPISASVAAADEHFKAFPELGEEKYPAFLAVPVFARGTVAAVLVLQRSEASEFTPAEVALATALSTTFSHALERAASPTADSPMPRAARLVGTARCTGSALGRALMLGTLEALRDRASAVTEPGPLVERAFADIAGLIRKAVRRVEATLEPAALRQLRSYTLMLDDQRFLTTLITQCERHGLLPGLKQVVREYASASYLVEDGQALLEERAQELEHLCLLVALSACNYPLPSPGSILVVAERVTAVLALAVIGGRAEGVLVSGQVPENDLGVMVARAGGVPLVCDIAGLFAWVRPDDTLHVDADAGVIRINPPATTIVKFKQQAK